MYGSNVRNAQLPVARPGAEPGDAQLIDRARNYKILVVTPNQNSAVFPADESTRIARTSPPFKFAGDTLTVLNIEGQDHVAISLNRGQYIPVRVGAVIHRDFTEFRVRAFGWLPPSAGFAFTGPFSPFPTEIVLAVSYGPLVEYDDTFRPGFKAGCPKFRGSATATGVDIFAGSLDAINAAIPRQVLKYGGTMMIRNRGAASLYLYDGTPGSFNNAGAGPNSPNSSWEILQNEVFTMQADGRLSASTSTVVGAAFPLRVCLACAGAGPVAYTAMLSSWGDASDPESGTSLATGLEYGDRT